MKYYRKINKLDEEGFTLMEIMVAMAIGLFLSAVMYKTVTSNNKAVALQMRKAEIQQNLRASIFVLETEIKRIGFNPKNLQGVHAPRITGADRSVLSFQYDLNENGRSFSVNGTGYTADVLYSEGNITPLTDPNEVIRIDLGSVDSDGTASLMRDTTNVDGNSYELVVANNIEALNFVYLDNNGEPLKVDGELVGYPVPADSLPLIKKIQVTIVVRSSRTRCDYINTHNYSNAQGEEVLSAKNDGYDRLLLTKTIDCRNLGLL